MRNLEPGPVFCIVTPFKEDGSIDFEALEKYINNCADAGANKFYVMAYNSRFSELSWDEIKTLSVRFRTLGCYPLTAGIESNAKSVQDIIKEVKKANYSERSGRLIDYDKLGSMELKKREGYF